MPALDQIDPTSLASRIRLWLLTHPGAHRPRDIAKGMTRPPERTPSQWCVDVGRECSRMASKGWLTRDQQGPRLSYYGLPEVAAPATSNA